MKKVFSLIMIFCVTLLTGIMLTACTIGKDSYMISLSYSQEVEDLIDVSLVSEKITLTKNAEGKYDVNNGANVKINITAKREGVDFSNFVVKVGDIEKQVITNSNYSQLQNSQDLYYGYFLISSTNSDYDIYFSGAKIMSSTFIFETQNLEDEDVIEKLKMTQISLNRTENYINLYDYLTDTQNQPVVVRKFESGTATYNSYSTFKIKFDGVAPFDFVQEYPFKIKVGTNEREIKSMTLLNDYYLVDLGNLGDSEVYTIVVDFKDVEYQKYGISVPSENLSYSISLTNNVIDYSQEVEITLTKLLGSEKANYEKMRVLLNDRELSPTQSQENSNVIKYKIPKKITPISVGKTLGYTISVEDIEYLVSSYTLTAELNETIKNTNNFINYEIYEIDDSGVKKGVLGVNSEGKQLSLSGERNALVWKYNYDSSAGGYRSVYDLYDYDLYLNSTFKILNVKECLESATENVSKTLSNGYVFKALYNKDTKVFDSFQLEFVCSDNANFIFTNFVLFQKNIEISYSFEDSRISSVEYAVLTGETTSSETNWTTLQKDNNANVTVVGGTVIAFRLTSDKNLIGQHEFKIQNLIICNSWYPGENSTGDNGNYIIYRFIVSDIQYSNIMPFVLVPAGTI